MPNKDNPGGYNNFHIGNRLEKLSKFPNAKDILSTLGTNIKAWVKEGSFWNEREGREVLTANLGIDGEVHAINYEGMPTTYLEEGSLAEVAIAFASQLQKDKARRERWEREVPKEDQRRREKESKLYPTPVDLSLRLIKHHLNELDVEVAREPRFEIIDATFKDSPETE